MQKPMQMLFLVFLLLLSPSQVVASDMSDADAAYNKSDYVEAFQLYQKAANQGYPKAQFELGRMYFFGQGVHQDYAEAGKWFHKAVEEGNLHALYELVSTVF